MRVLQNSTVDFVSVYTVDLDHKASNTGRAHTAVKPNSLFRVHVEEVVELPVHTGYRGELGEYSDNPDRRDLLPHNGVLVKGSADVVVDIYACDRSADIDVLQVGWRWSKGAFIQDAIRFPFAHAHYVDTQAELSRWGLVRWLILKSVNIF